LQPKPNLADRRSARRLSVAAMVLAALALAACSSDEDVPYVERPVNELYNEAVTAMDGRNFTTAANLFDEVERQHPYSVWATRAQIMAAYANYQKNDYDAAIVALDRFIELHPAHRDVPYAYYLKGLCYYEQISDVARDQQMTARAQQTMQELITRYPRSKYARDAKVKIDLTNDHLAGKEMEIGRYYLNLGHYLPAINRFKTVVEKYQTTTHVPEALHRLAEAYVALGVPEEARKYAAVLGHNFPGSEWYIDSFEMVENGRQSPVAEGTPWYQFW
jgi:outer membrane protein assembly factor BamD